MKPHFGAPLKAVAWTVGPDVTRGEAIVSARGLEGGGVYTLSRGIRKGLPVTLDLLPDANPSDLIQRLHRAGPKASLSNRLRKALKLDPVKQALAQEWARPLPTKPDALVNTLRALAVPHNGFLPMDEAISTAGGVPFDALDADFMLHDRPGTYCAGEMLDWDAPTGGYLITACLATGRWAGLAAVKRLGLG
jgi:predicted flavoprotein YhiN